MKNFIVTLEITEKSWFTNHIVGQKIITLAQAKSNKDVFEVVDDKYVGSEFPSYEIVNIEEADGLFNPIIDTKYQEVLDLAYTLSQGEVTIKSFFNEDGDIKFVGCYGDIKVPASQLADMVPSFDFKEELLEAMADHHVQFELVELC